MRQGLYCSRIAVPDEWLLDVDDGLDLAQVAAMPVAGITAYRALHTCARIEPDDRVLILGARSAIAS